MEDLDDSMSSPRFEPLFIKEEEVNPDNMAQSGLSFTQMNQSALIKPYLQEMDDLLKSCEELTGIPFSSHFSAGYDETSQGESTHNHSKEEEAMESHEERSASPQPYLYTRYIDTHMDGAGIEDQQVQGQSQGSCTVINRCAAIADVPRQREMPLTSAGHKLSDTMVEYEGQLLGMLAMLENCMEEAGMDFEQDWATDGSQEYVHIRKNPRTTLAPIQQDSDQAESRTAQHSVQDNSKECRNDTTTGSQQNPASTSGNTDGFLMEQLESQGNLKTDEVDLELHFRLSEPLNSKENHPMQQEAPKTGDTSPHEGPYMRGDVTGIEVDDTGLPDEEGHEPTMDTTDSGSAVTDLEALGFQMEEYIGEVQRLQNRRKELLAEVLELRGNKEQEVAVGRDEKETEETIDSRVAELIKALKKEEEMRRGERKREIQSLREERAEEEKRMWKVNLERQGLHEELRKLKRRLFTMARDCAHSQFALNTQSHEVEQLKREEENLQSLVIQLREEGSQLRTAQKQQLLDLQAQHHAQSTSQISNSQDELNQYRRRSCGDIQQYLQGGLRALEERYEPIMLALLKRREVTAGALVKAREQAQELRAQLRPLKDEIQKLKLQRSCLEEKLNLIHIQRREDVGQYKETVYFLEESSRELKNELQIQKRKTKEMNELRDSLTKQLLLCRAAIEDHNQCDEEEKR